MTRDHLPKGAPGARGGAVALHPREARPVPTLEESLRDALEGVLHGERRGPELARRAEREARAILLRRGFKESRVRAIVDGGDVIVEVLLPPEAPRVGAVVVRLG